MQPLSPELSRTFNGFAPARELSLAEAQAAVVALGSQLPRPQVHSAPSLSDAGGRVLAEDVHADRDAPPFRRALRDGYAVRAADGDGRRRCLGEVAAGHTYAGELPAGACIAIMTGAPVPLGADAIVMVEHTCGVEDCIELQRRPSPGDHIALPGSDTPSGGVVAAAGRRVDAAVVAALASVGCLHPRIWHAPRVAVLSTGDELVSCERAPATAQLRDSNTPMLAALAINAGAEVVIQRRLPDRRHEIEAALRAALVEADVVISSGGASVGAHDGVAAALAELGAEIAFDAVRIRPGRPVRCALAHGRLVLVLPGNPLGAWLGFELLARPALELLAGQVELAPRIICAPLGFAWARPSPLPLILFLPVRFRGGEWHEVLYHGSADLAAAAAADGFLLVPENTTALARGASVQVLLK